MTAVVFYFQVHQPYRLTRRASFEGLPPEAYFDDAENRRIVRRVADKCYVPMTRVLADLIEEHEGAFRCSFSISGTALSQMRAWAPKALQAFVDLADTGCVEFLCETGYHSLASQADKEEFDAQVGVQRATVEDLFGTAPTTFRNTELVVDEGVARRVEGLGFDALLGEGAEQLLGDLSPRQVYRAGGTNKTRLLLRDFPFSDDIAFRFSNRDWPCYPLMADTFAEWIHAAPPEDVFIGLFMDYETFGEHQWADTGILEFMRHLPAQVLADERFSFRTPREVAAEHEPVYELPYPRPVSWADEERDLSAWLSNPMQRAAHRAIYDLGPRVRAAAALGHAELLETWRKLTTSDHVYYMCTKFHHSDGDVHEYFTPYESPHDSYTLLMNVVADLEGRVEEILSTSETTHGNDSKTIHPLRTQLGSVQQGRRHPHGAVDQGQDPGRDPR